KLMTEPRPVPGGLRTRGWDCDTSYSANRGTAFPKGQSFGHTGFTGTSLWLDPATKTAVIFLSNRVHPDGKGNVTKLRGEVATLAAAAVGVRSQESGVRDQGSGVRSREAGTKPLTPVLSGLDVLERDGFAALKGRKVGLV